jgi:uroporphyrinogen-III decarboxylase
MKGGLDKFALTKGPAAIKTELEYKMQPLMQQGGLVFGLDHRIVNGTPLENYRYYVDAGRAMLNLLPRTPARQGWRRMAF